MVCFLAFVDVAPGSAAMGNAQVGWLFSFRVLTSKPCLHPSHLHPTFFFFPTQKVNLSLFLLACSSASQMDSYL